MILKDTDIENLAKLESLLVPYNPENLRRASYDLSVGAEFCVFDGKDVSKNPVIQYHTLTKGQPFQMPPNAVCFISCAEQISLPKDICARVFLRMSYIYKGIVVASQPPFDPGYQGMVIVMVHNMSSLPMPIKEGDRFVTIEFERTTGEYAETTHPSKNVLSFHQPLNGKIVTSLQGLESGFRRIKKRVDSLYFQLISFILLLIAVPTFLFLYSFASLSNKIEDQQKEIDKLRVEVKINNSTPLATTNTNPPNLQIPPTPSSINDKTINQGVSK